MKRPVERIRTRIIAPFVCALVIAVAVTIAGFHNYQQRTLDREIVSQIRGAKRLIRFTLSKEANLLTSLLQRLDSDTLAQRSFHVRDRDGLSTQVDLLYGDTKEQFGVTHLSFIDADKTCFLRIHDPQSHGDKIDSRTLEVASQDQKPTRGFELGRDGSLSLRVVHPWMIGRQLGGYIEIGKEIDKLVPVLHDIMGLNLVFFVNKNYLARAQWQQGEKSVENGRNWDRFPNHVVVSTTLAQLPDGLIENLGPHGHFRKDGIFQISGPAQFIGGYVPLVDVQGDEVVNIAVLTNITEKLSEMKALETRMAAGCILAVAVLLVVFFLYLGRIEQRLVKSASALKTEVTERRQAEDKYRDLVQNANSIIMRRDETGVITFFNEYAQEFFGYSEEEILGRNVIGTIVPEVGMHNEDLAAMIRDIGKHTDLFSTNENENMRRNGERVWVAWTNKVIPDDAGGGKEILCVGNDITARKLAEDEKRRQESRVLQAQKLESLAVLAGGIAHDFNNLLQGVVGNASLALERLPEDSRARRRIAEIQKGAGRAAKLCKLMLAFSGQGKSIAQTFDINRVATDMTKALRTLAPDNVSIKSRLAGSSLPIEGDPNQIRQVILALITNATEAMEGLPGSIAISTFMRACGQDVLRDNAMNADLPDGDYVVLQVSDEGCGMDEETRKKIFEPFFSTKFVGRGLNLAAVSGIIRGHRGAIATQSRPGAGTTISILLPLSDKPLSENNGNDAKRPKASVESIARPEGNTVLVADDEEDVLSITELMLRELGFDVLTAKDGNEAVEAFKTHKEGIAAVILDITMPNKDGVEALEEILAIQKDVKAILASGYSQQEATDRRFGNGVAEYIQKPFEFKALGHLLQSLLNTEPSSV